MIAVSLVANAGAIKRVYDFVKIYVVAEVEGETFKRPAAARLFRV